MEQWIYENNDLETSLSLAAEVGNMDLALFIIDNGELNHNVINLNSIITELLLKLQELKNAKSNQFNYQLQVKELAIEKEALA